MIMNILFLYRGGYTTYDLVDGMRELGVNCVPFNAQFEDKNKDAVFEEELSKEIRRGNYDAIQSINYYPVIAEVAHRENIIYLSWSYDNPLDVLNIEETLGYETNRVFLFDKIQVAKYQNMGFRHIYHLPLAVNCKRLEKMTFSRSDEQRFSCDVSLVGKLYESQLPLILGLVNDFQKGYIEGLVESQQNVYGYFFAEGLLTEKLMEEINISVKERNPGLDLKISKDALAYSIGTMITRKERLMLLTLLSNRYSVKLFSGDQVDAMERVRKMGRVDYMTQMPGVFRFSKINLNCNLRVSQSGIPLRVMDILGSGGFLLSSFQPEVAEYFRSDEEVVLYESMEDACEKVEFYLKHEDIRLRIAEKGHEAVKNQFSYRNQLTKLYQTAL